MGSLWGEPVHAAGAEQPTAEATPGEDQAVAGERGDHSAACGRARSAELRPVPASDRELAEMRALGKLISIDPMTGQRVISHLTDYLPAGWGRVGDRSRRLDSLGEAIVNEVPGLPGWTQQNVAALREAISGALAQVIGGKAAHRGEAEAVLGNYLGQALVRGVDVADLLDLDGELITSTVARSAVDQLRFYEDLKRQRSDGWGFTYEPGAYGEEVLRWLEVHGGPLEEILASEALEVPGTSVTPSGCYTKSKLSRGMSLISGATVIWETSGEDDFQADVPIGFRFYFYGCDDPDPNLNVRVSTNGYLTFFEQGGGALDGTDYSNDPITTDEDPDGYVAPNWDDLWVALSQGLPDKVSYVTEGAVGERVFTVEWHSLSTYGAPPGATDFHTFQAKLIEATGDVELHIGDMLNDPDDGSTVGMESYAGSDGDCGPNCGVENTTATMLFNYRFQPVRPMNDDPGPSAGCLAASDQPSVAGSTLGATGTDSSSCAINDGHDVWYWYRAPVTGAVTFSTCGGASFDTTLALFDLDVTTEYSCSNDSCGQQSTLTHSLVAGQEYMVRVAGHDGHRGDFVLTATPAAVPLGDTCADGHFLSVESVGFTDNNTGCLDDSIGCGAQDTIDEWFRWTAPATRPYWFSTCDPGTDFDTTLVVYDDCGDPQLGCNDNKPDETCSLLRLDATSGIIYHVRVAGSSSSHGNYVLRVLTCPYDETLSLTGQTITEEETFGACDTLTAGTSFVIDAGGVVTFHAGNGIVLTNGFSVLTGGELSAITEPAMAP